MHYDTEFYARENPGRVNLNLSLIGHYEVTFISKIIYGTPRKKIWLILSMNRGRAPDKKGY